MPDVTLRFENNVGSVVFKLDGVPPSLLRHRLAHGVQVVRVHGIRRDGLGDVIATCRDVHAVQEKLLYLV